jgi:O-6-methylguanine DNA methyltransferase
LKLFLDRFASPIGEITAVSDGHALRALGFHDDAAEMLEHRRRRDGALELVEGTDPLGVRSRLERYFAKEFDAFAGLRLRADGTAFQHAVWDALVRIPVGTTTSYGALAKSLGVPGAARAVGLANGSNPIAIVVPCHRVIGSNGTLTGYGGGLPRKAWLLRHEGVRMPSVVLPPQTAFAFVDA